MFSTTRIGNVLHPIHSSKLTLNTFRSPPLNDSLSSYISVRNHSTWNKILTDLKNDPPIYTKSVLNPFQVVPQQYKAIHVKDFITEQKAKRHPFTILPLANFNGEIKIHTSETLNNAELVCALSTCPEIDTVDISGHSEVNNLVFSRFRKYLPKLKFIFLNNISPEDCEITVDQIAKYFAKEISIIADKALMKHFQKLMVEYLMRNQQQDYAQQIQQMEILPCILDTEKVQTAILFEENKRNELATQQHQQWLEQDAANQAVLEQLFSDYKNGTGFYVNSKWFIKGPGPNDCFSKELYALYLVITKLNLWPVVAQGPGSMGFTFSSPQALDAVHDHPAIRACGHSGASFGLLMRKMEQIAIAGSFQDYVEKITASSQARLRM